MKKFYYKSGDDGGAATSRRSSREEVKSVAGSEYSSVASSSSDMSHVKKFLTRRRRKSSPGMSNVLSQHKSMDALLRKHEIKDDDFQRVMFSFVKDANRRTVENAEKIKHAEEMIGDLQRNFDKQMTSVVEALKVINTSLKTSSNNQGGKKKRSFRRRKRSSYTSSVTEESVYNVTTHQRRPTLGSLYSTTTTQFPTKLEGVEMPLLFPPTTANSSSDQLAMETSNSKATVVRTASITSDVSVFDNSPPDSEPNYFSTTATTQSSIRRSVAATSCNGGEGYYISADVNCDEVTCGHDVDTEDDVSKSGSNLYSTIADVGSSEVGGSRISLHRKYSFMEMVKHGLHKFFPFAASLSRENSRRGSMVPPSSARPYLQQRRKFSAPVTTAHTIRYPTLPTTAYKRMKTSSSVQHSPVLLRNNYYPNLTFDARRRSMRRNSSISTRTDYSIPCTYRHLMNNRKSTAAAAEDGSAAAGRLVYSRPLTRTVHSEELPKAKKMKFMNGWVVLEISFICLKVQLILSSMGFKLFTGYLSL